MSLTAAEYCDWILARIQHTVVVNLALSESYGLALAETLRAELDLPLWDSSAMDGYALRIADVASASTDSPVRLRVQGEVAAGDAADPDMTAGTAIRIMTGAPVPSAADAVVPIEQTHRATAGAATASVIPVSRESDAWDDQEIWVTAPIASGANIRRRGEDIRQSDVIAHRGDSLNAARLSALAAVGIGEVSVYRAPRIAVLSTGSELRPAGTQLQRGEIPESNSVLLGGLLREAGLPAITIAYAADSVEQLRDQIGVLAAEHDAIITTGGVGPGKYDVVRLALADEPGIRSARVKIRPGQPQCSGRHRAGAFLFCLPGNPVSAAVSFELFVRPALRTMAGYQEIYRRKLLATAAVAWPGKSGSLQVLPVKISETDTGLSCVPAVPPRGASHAVAQYGASDGYALVEAERAEVRAGELVQIIETGLR